VVAVDATMGEKELGEEILGRVLAAVEAS